MTKIVVVGLFLWGLYLSLKLGILEEKIQTIDQYIIQQQLNGMDDTNNTQHL